jgi:septum formation protein
VRITPDTPIVLGSGSPRRRELLTLAGVPFVVCVANADESARAGEPAGPYLERVAEAKLHAVRALLAKAPGGPRDDGILVADTIVVAADGGVLGKPQDEGEGRAMLERLSGATHSVQTRFLLARTAGPIAYACTVVTAVTFRPLSAEEIARYVAGGEGRDKAGGYALQGGAAVFCPRLEGSYTNVIGLPLCEVVTALGELGWIPT